MSVCTHAASKVATVRQAVLTVLTAHLTHTPLIIITAVHTRSTDHCLLLSQRTTVLYLYCAQQQA
jgi:hypothetical protein